MSALSAASTALHPAGSRLAAPLLRLQPDDRLAALAGDGSDAAFEEIVRRYRGGLVAFAARICTWESADDVVQDSMVKAHSALARGDRPDNPRAWLFTIVRNTALNDRRDRPVHEHLDENYDGVEQPPEAAERRRQVKQLVVALNELPAAQRQALIQRELEGRGHEEIAADLSVSPGAVRQLIFRARSALRTGLGFLVPMQVLRATVLSGAGDQVAGGAAAAGAGMAAKLGLGAVLATGALVAGTQVAKEPAGGAGARAQDSAETPQAAEFSSESAGSVSHRRRVVVPPRAAKEHSNSAGRVAGPQAARHDAAPPRPADRPPPAGDGHQANRPGGQDHGGDRTGAGGSYGGDGSYGGGGSYPQGGSQQQQQQQQQQPPPGGNLNVAGQNLGGVLPY